MANFPLVKNCVKCLRVFCELDIDGNGDNWEVDDGRQIMHEAKKVGKLDPIKLRKLKNGWIWNNLKLWNQGKSLEKVG